MARNVLLPSLYVFLDDDSKVQNAVQYNIAKKVRANNYHGLLFYIDHIEFMHYSHQFVAIVLLVAVTLAHCHQKTIINTVYDTLSLGPIYTYFKSINWLVRIL